MLSIFTAGTPLPGLSDLLRQSSEGTRGTTRAQTVTTRMCRVDFWPDEKAHLLTSDTAPME